MKLASILFVLQAAVLVLSVVPAVAAERQMTPESMDKPKVERKQKSDLARRKNKDCDKSLTLWHGGKNVWTKSGDDIRKMKSYVQLPIERLRNPHGISVAELLPPGKKSGLLEFRSCGGKSVFIEASREDGPGTGGFLIPSRKKASIKLVELGRQGDGNGRMLMKQVVGAYFPASDAEANPRAGDGGGQRSQKR